MFPLYHVAMKWPRASGAPAKRKLSWRHIYFGFTGKHLCVLVTSISISVIAGHPSIEATPRTPTVLCVICAELDKVMGVCSTGPGSRGMGVEGQTGCGCTAPAVSLWQVLVILRYIKS